MRRDRSLRTAVATATALALLAAIGVVLVLGDDGSDAEPVTADGSEAPGLDLEPRDPDEDALRTELRTFDGSSTTLGEMVGGGTPTVVNFFASWCTPCVREMPVLEEVHQELGDRVRFVGLAMQDRPEDALRTIETTGVTYDVARDVGGELIEAVGATVMPTTVFVDGEGAIVEVSPGELSRDELTGYLEDLFGVDV